MAIQTLNNGEAGVVVRGKLNSNFAEHAASLAALGATVDGMFLGFDVIRKLTQAEYNAIATPDAQTLYIIVG